MKKGKKKILICGGHFSPAFALIEELQKNKDLELYYLGRKFALEQDESLSLEYKEITKNKIKFLEITSGRLDRFISAKSLLSLFKIPIGFIQSLKYLLEIKPALVMSFGSYVALPVSSVAYLLRIPVITHEQTRIMGITNRIISLFAKASCLTYSDTKKVPKLANTVLTGLPVRESILHPENSGITKFGNTKLPLIFITGGSLGSVSLNRVYFKIIPQVLESYRIFHICGQSNEMFDYHRLSKLRNSLKEKSKKNYFLTPLLENEKIGEVISNSELIIGRSGANSTAEILIHNKKSILIPLPWSAGNEQFENAQYLKELGLATVLLQDKLNPEELMNSIDKTFSKKTPQKTVNTEFISSGRKKLGELILDILMDRQ